MKKLRLNRVVVRRLDDTQLQRAGGGMNLSLQNCPTAFCTTGTECSSLCGGPTGAIPKVPTLHGCTTAMTCP